MDVDKKMVKLQANTEATERWQRKLFRAANELQKLAKERKRLLGPRKPTTVKYRNFDEIRMAMTGGDFHSDDIPL
jgi:hypothetical protein